MRWVERGPKPDGVDGYDRQFTQGWVDYFRHSRGGRPTDSYWREFRSALGQRSGDNCWYCERRCEAASEVGGRAATVDHFRPVSRFPELVYEWENWAFSCRRCNGENKQDKWSALGYVDPSAEDAQDRPDRYFDYDMRTGDIIPHPSLRHGSDPKSIAEVTIRDLGLNLIDLKYYRTNAIRQFVEDLRTFPTQDRQAFAEFFLTGFIEYAGAAEMVVGQLRATGEI